MLATSTNWPLLFSFESSTLTPLPLVRMAHDITEEFRIIVDQKRKDFGDSRRSRLGRPPHPTPGDLQIDSAPQFMQAYMKEAYVIVSHHMLSFYPPLRMRSYNILRP
jgi:hypothetical protein